MEHIQEVGFLPLLDSGVRGYSAEDLVDEDCRYVVHRVIRIEGDEVTLMGDGNLRGTESCQKRDVRALATHVVGADNQRHDLYTPWRRWAAKGWWYLRPVRRYLLYIYRHVKGLK